VAQLTATVTTDDRGPGDPYTVLELAGEADVTSSETLRALLEAQIRERPGLLIVELSALLFIDSAALQVVLRASRALRARGGLLALASPGDVVARVLEMTGADRLIPVYDSVAKAAAARGHSPGA
jgi:anti-anti-sigma factor